MSIKRLAILSLLLTLLAPLSRAAISINYNNATGAYSVSGFDPGPGLNPGGFIGIVWTWASEAQADEVNALITALVGDTGLTGTVNGSDFVADGPVTANAEDMGFMFSTPLETGEFVMDSTSGIVASGLWTFGDGAFIGAPGSFGTSTDPLTLSVGVVPEPATWATLVGVAALGLTALRRRRV